MKNIRLFIPFIGIYYFLKHDNDSALCRMDILLCVYHAIYISVIGYMLTPS